MKKKDVPIQAKTGPADRSTRRNFLKHAGLLAAGGLGLATGRQTRAGTSPGKTVHVGVFGPSHCSSPFVYAAMKEYFKKYKHNVELINYNAMPDAAKDLASGKLDLTQFMVPLAFALHTGSGPFAKIKTPVVLTQFTGINGSALMVRNGSGISSPKDFSGRIIASHAKYSTHYLYMRRFLEKHGIDYKKDAQFKMIPLEKIIPAMAKGELDTLFLMEPRNAIIEHKGIGKAYMLSKYIWPNHPCCGLVARRETFDNQKEVITAVTKAVTQAALEINEASRRAQAIDVLRKSPKHKFDKLPRSVIEKAFTPGRSDFAPFPYLSSARVIIELMKRYELLPKETNDATLAKEVFQMDFARSVFQSLGAKAPNSNFRTEKVMGELRAYS